MKEPYLTVFKTGESELSLLLPKATMTDTDEVITCLICSMRIISGAYKEIVDTFRFRPGTHMENVTIKVNELHAALIAMAEWHDKRPRGAA